MAEQFEVKPDELRRVSGDLHDASWQIKAVMSTLRAQLAGEGTPWGQFASGADGAQAQIHRVVVSCDPDMTSRLDYLADYLGRCADIFERSDEV
jgi:hypothetical protein